MLKFDSEKKHSIRYKSKQPAMTVYVPKEVLSKLAGNTAANTTELKMTLELTS